MKLHIHGLDEPSIGLAISETKKLINLPKNLDIYFIKGNYYKEILNSLPKRVAKDLRKVIKRGSLSYSFKKRHLIIIQFENKGYLLKNRKALIGLLLHEVFHTIQRKKGLDTRLKRSYKKFYLKKLIELKRLNYDQKSLEKLFLSIGSGSLLLVKELYTNTEVINRGFSDYLVEYYKEEFPRTHKCPKPVFYDKFKIAAKKDMNIIELAFRFEFSLLSFILPFKKLDNKQAKRLSKHIKLCYEVNIEEIARKCKEISFVYIKNFKKKNFQKEFFEEIFLKVYNLLS